MHDSGLLLLIKKLMCGGCGLKWSATHELIYPSLPASPGINVHFEEASEAHNEAIMKVDDGKREKRTKWQRD